MVSGCSVRIEIDSIVGSKGVFAHVYSPGELGFEDDRVSLSGPPEVSGQLVLKGKRVFLQGRLVAPAHVNCDRCLRVVDLAIESQFRLEYVTRIEYESSQAVELEDEDMTVSVFDGEAIDIDELVREQVFLAIPERNLCREDCKGICPSCGIDRNMKECGCESAESDPRWAALKNLQL